MKPSVPKARSATINTSITVSMRSKCKRPKEKRSISTMNWSKCSPNISMRLMPRSQTMRSQSGICIRLHLIDLMLEKMTMIEKKSGVDGLISSSKITNDDFKPLWYYLNILNEIERLPEQFYYTIVRVCFTNHI